MILLIDLLLLAGFSALVYGLWLVFGTGWACIIGGAIVLAAGVFAALRLPGDPIASPTDR